MIVTGTAPPNIAYISLEAIGTTNQYINNTSQYKVISGQYSFELQPGLYNLKLLNSRGEQLVIQQVSVTTDQLSSLEGLLQGL